LKKTNSNLPLRIAIIGPESSGKSQLCDQLATHYQTVWVEEYAREYLNNLNRKYTLDDVIEIYKVQLQKENEALAHAGKYLFVDTEFIVAKVWCEHAFNSSPAYIEQMINEHPYDYYLLTDNDLPWEFDVLRENPGKGDFFFDWYKGILDSLKLHYGVVNGAGKDRLRNAIKLTDNFFG